MQRQVARRLVGAQLLAGALLFACRGPAPSTTPPPEGLIVEEVDAGYGAARAGVRPGDTLVAWRGDGDRELARGAGWTPLRAPSDLESASLRAGQTIAVALRVERAGRSLELALPPAPWKVETHPRFTPGGENRFREGRRAIVGGQVARGTRIWEALAHREGVTRPASGCWLAVAIARTVADAGLAEQIDSWTTAALRFAEQSHDPELRAWTWGQIGAIREAAKQKEAAIDAYGKGIDEAAATPMWADHLRLRLGDARFRASDHAGAGEAYRRAREGWERRGERGADFVTATIGLGKVERNFSRFDQAAAHLEEARAVAERLDSDHPYVASSLQEAGMLAYWQSDLALAEQRYEEAAIRFRRLGVRDNNLANLIMGRGIVALERGELATAEWSFEEARGIFEKNTPGSLLVAWSLRGLGQVAHVRGELSLADRRYREALRLLDALGQHTADRAFVLREIGAVAQEQGALESAREATTQALEILERGYPSSKFPPRARTSLGVVLLDLGELEEARRQFETAMQEWERLLPGSLDHADTHHQMGEWARRTGDMGLARFHHEAALAIRARLAPHSFIEATSHHALGRIARSTSSSPQDALAHLELALESLESQAGSLGASELSRARFRARHAAVYKETIDLLLELGEQARAFDLLERYRAQQGRELLAQRPWDIHGAVRPELVKRRNDLVREYEATWRSLSRADAAPEHRSAVDRLHGRLAELEQERQIVNDRLRSLDPELAARVEPAAVGLNDLSRRLGDEVAVLSYSVMPEETWLFAVRDGRLEVHRIEVGEDRLAELVDRFRLLLAAEGPQNAGRRSLERRGRDLYRLLIAPAESTIGPADRLIILADGPLHHLPFAALVRSRGDGSESELLLESKPFHMRDTLGDLRAEGAAPRPPGARTARGDRGALLAFADAVPRSVEAAASGRDDERTETTLRSGLGPLPYTRHEASALRDLFGSSAEIHLGPDATEASAKRRAGGFRYLHFATHALLDSASPLDSSLVLSPAPAGSGSDEDGLLRAWEVIEEVRIDAEVVTLSACESALGEELAGTGFVGLTHAFRVAGARSVVASLWRVQDRSTAELMVRFYERLRAGARKDEALRQAQLELLRDPAFSHPHHWAAFQLYGDGE